MTESHQETNESELHGLSSTAIAKETESPFIISGFKLHNIQPDLASRTVVRFMVAEPVFSRHLA